MATVDENASAVGAGALFNPETYDGADLDPEARRLMLATIEWFEQRGKVVLKQHDRERDLVRGLPRVRRARAGLRHPADPGARRGWRRGEALGHDADLRLQRDHRVLRARLLVHVAGLDPRARADLAERQRGGAAARGRVARRRRDLRLRPLREGPRRGHLLDRHGPHAGRRRLQGQRREVLHRQRQPGRDGVGLRAPGGRRGSRRLRVLRRRQPASELPADQERRQLADRM